jgi:hypothetical protein
MKIQLSKAQRELVTTARREFAAILENFNALRTERDKLVALLDTSRRSAAELLDGGAPEKDADTIRLLILERRETWAEKRLELAQLGFNSGGEQVRDFLLSEAKPLFESILSPALTALREEIAARLAPMVGQHQAQAAASDSEPVRKLRNFLTFNFIAPTPDKGPAALEWLDAVLRGELPREAREAE